MGKPPKPHIVFEDGMWSVYKWMSFDRYFILWGRFSSLSKICY